MKNEAPDIESIAVRRPVDMVASDMIICVGNQNPSIALAQKYGGRNQSTDASTKYDYLVAFFRSFEGHLASLHSEHYASPSVD